MDNRDLSAAAALETALWNFFETLGTTDQRRAMLTRLIESPELRLPPDPGGRAETRPGSAPSPESVVRLAYATLLGRPADDSGLAHYAQALRSGEPLIGVVKALTSSPEFEQRCRRLPRDTQLCELANPAKWDNEEWLDILRSLNLAVDKLLMHRKPYEFAQLIFGCRRLGVLQADATVMSVGAGHEHVVYWFANHVGHVYATDLYEGTWQVEMGREGDPSVIGNPERYAPFPYRRERLTFMKMDGRHLAFKTGSLDLAWSLSSIEHFGGLSGASATLKEMARVLKPGGILALATEYVLQGPPHEETFQPAEFHTLIDQPDLELVEPIDERVYQRYEYTPVDLHTHAYETPHMVVRFDDTVFTTVMAFLRKR